MKGTSETKQSPRFREDTHIYIYIYMLIYIYIYMYMKYIYIYMYMKYIYIYDIYIYIHDIYIYMCVYAQDPPMNYLLGAVATIYIYIASKQPGKP